MSYDYRYDGYGLTIYTPCGSCYLQGDEAADLFDELEACCDQMHVEMILRDYDEVCE